MMQAYQRRQAYETARADMVFSDTRVFSSLDTHVAM